MILLQWKPFNVITVNVISCLLLLELKGTIYIYYNKITRYCYHSVIVVSFDLSQSDHMKRHLLYILLKGNHSMRNKTLSSWRITNRKTGKNTDGQRDKQRYRETDKDSETRTKIQTETDTIPETLTKAQRDRHNPKIRRDRQKHRDTDAVRETKKVAERRKDKQTDRQTQSAAVEWMPEYLLNQIFSLFEPFPYIVPNINKWFQTDRKKSFLNIQNISQSKLPIAWLVLTTRPVHPFNLTISMHEWMSQCMKLSWMKTNVDQKSSD